MHWYYYLAQFFGGAFLANGVPHFVQGVCGNRFQTPFASPPGKGETPAIVNVLWGWFNLVVGAALLRYFFPESAAGGAIAAAAGALVIGLMLANHFGKVRHAAPHP